MITDRACHSLAICPSLPNQPMPHNDNEFKRFPVSDRQHSSNLSMRRSLPLNYPPNLSSVAKAHIASVPNENNSLESSRKYLRTSVNPLRRREVAEREPTLPPNNSGLRILESRYSLWSTETDGHSKLGDRTWTTRGSSLVATSADRRSTPICVSDAATGP